MRAVLIAALLLLMALPLQSAPLERINLQAWYDGYNEEYFLNQLPKATAVYRDSDNSLMGYSSWGDRGYLIVISPTLSPTPGEAQLTLLHEMCHVATYKDWDLDAHGPHWRSCMHRLANEGAFDLLW